MKKAISFLVGLLLIASPAAASTFTYEAPASQTATVGQSILTIWELSNGNWDSRREALVFPQGQYGYEKAEGYLCPNEKISAGTYPCNFAESGADFFGSNILPVCLTEKENFCVENLNFQVSGSQVVGQHIGYAGGSSFSAIPELGIEPGGLVSLWRLAGVNNSAASDTYAVTVRSRQGYDPYYKRFYTVSLDLSVTPYLEVKGNYSPPIPREGKDVNGLNKVYGGVPQGCTWSDEGRCGKAADFGTDVEVSLSIRASNELSGWFRGRISETNISITKFSDKANRIVVSGKPVTVPRFHVYADAQNTPKNVQELFPRGVGGTGLELFEGNSVKQVFSTDGQKSYTLLDGMRTAVRDTAAGTTTLWSIESIPLGNQPCFAKAEGLIGVVSTNATAYDGTAPGFSDGQLTYKVAGLHYAPDGKTLNLGTYDLVMRSDVARCLYGFSAAPVSAKIQVLTDNGEAVLASTIVNEQNGWLNLAAYGFTFSEKNIKVELIQAPTPVIKATVSGFSGSAVQLSKSQKRDVLKLTNQIGYQTKAACTAWYSTPQSRSLALKRAQSICSEVKKQRPQLVTSMTAAKSANKTLVGKVSVKFN